MYNKMMGVTVFFAFTLGFITYLFSYKFLPGKYEGRTASFIDVHKHSEQLFVSFHSELEFTRDGRYELMLLTGNQSASFTAGEYKYESSSLTLHELQHDSFQTIETLPFWEKVLTSPKTFGRTGLTVVPIEAGEQGFFIFSGRYGALMKRKA